MGTPRTASLRLAALLATTGLGIAACDSGSSGDSNPDPNPNPNPNPTPAPQTELPPRAASATSLDGVNSVGSMYWDNGTHTADGGQGDPVDNLACRSSSPVEYHVHTHLSIFLNGEALRIPAEVGFVDLSATEDCHYPVHTHNGSGMLHLHWTEPRQFTLGQFFHIWGRPLERDNVADFVDMPIQFFVTDEDNVVKEFIDDPADILLISHREVTIQIGTDIEEVPYYTWEGE